jgi:DNA-binding NarL/FixJ family response regulator
MLAVGGRLLREALARHVAARPGLFLVGQAATGTEALRLLPEQDPDVLVLDLDLRQPPALEVLERTAGRGARAEVVVLSARRHEAWERRVFAAGARAWLDRDRGLDDLEAAVAAAARGDWWPAEGPGGDRVAGLAGAAQAALPPGGRITPRERELACLLADGYSSREAAGILGISVKTADTHRAALMRKLAARNVADVVKYCIRNRLIDV